MNKYFLATLVVGLQILIADAQILRYKFDEGVGTTTTSSGSLPDSLILSDASGTPTTALWGEPGSGVSGSTDDRALDLTSATGMGSLFVGPSAFQSALSPVAAISQFTLTGWFRSSSTDLDRAHFLHVQNGNNILSLTGLAGGPVGSRSRLRFTMDDSDTFPEVDTFGNYESDWSTPDAWAYFAITYDGQSTTDTVQIYSGGLTAPVTLSTSSPESSIQFPLGGASIWIGADPSNEDPFQGFLEEFRLYGSVLTPSEIEQVRLSAVPEPGSMVLLLLGMLMFFRKWPRRHVASL